ncbi:MAG: tRNA pseudouridine(13) synthase TruD [Candidatus Thiodiazotropha taylori]|nr:tRNA pseudouridine(13) synthase TruD [Candidatus Thiodiazotropha taylori]MCG7975087.1 tRNA pseudouridine(13) synthase TruD [Candidatus Thiodiazotropha taylori]MCG8067497.1 tRNA pseudouridine(13) synthase TruD [Candidatus Thiodiazotropha taylori]
MSDQPWVTLAQMPYAHGTPVGRGVIRSCADDFQVDEELGFLPDEEGEHLLVQIRKRETNTQWLAGQLARLAGIDRKDVGFAGLKDRHAVTTQWFSLGMAGRPEPDWQALDEDLIEVLAVHRHKKKLRRGTLRGNHFVLRVRQLDAQQQAIETRLQQLQEAGMPNYFGEQRFGHDYSNLDQADRLFSPSRPRLNRSLRGLIISAARSQLFNQVLAARIEQGNWNRPLAGDYFQLDGSRGCFADHEEQPERLLSRCASLDIHPTGPLWGRGRSLVKEATESLERQLLSPFELWRNGLEHVGLQQERRALRVALKGLQWQFLEEGDLQLRFFLPAGCYATAMLRELLVYELPAVQE